MKPLYQYIKCFFRKEKTKLSWRLALLFFPLLTYAQRDSIFIKVQLDEVNYKLHVKQKLVYVNPLKREMDSVKMLSWVNAYRNSRTPLGKRKLEERKTQLYFSKKEERGFLENLSVDREQVEYVSNTREENIYLKLRTPLKVGKKITLEFEYDVQLPSAKITQYGYHENSLLLKYFFLVPDNFEDNKLSPKYFLDIEDNQSAGNYWDVKFEAKDAYILSNLKELSPSHFRGFLYEDPEFSIGFQNQKSRLSYTVNSKNIDIDLGYTISNEERALLDFYLPLQLKFIDDRIGFLPEKILLGTREKKQDGFLGSDDIVFKKWRFKVFETPERLDLNYFSMLSKSIVEKSFMADRNHNHWLYNGLKTYLEMQYLEKNYADEKLAGLLPEEVKIWKLKPLKWFNISDIDLIERYGLGYKYILTQNLDQAISTPLTELSKYNMMAVSNFEMGTIFSAIAEQMGHQQFNQFIKKYFEENRNTEISGKDFINQLRVASHEKSAYLESFIQKRNRVNFKVRSVKEVGNQLAVEISKNTDLPIPFKLQSVDANGEKNTYWLNTTTSKKAQKYLIPNLNTDKIQINNHYSFPEYKFSDNYIYTKGLFTNMRKLKFRFITDVPNPEYNEVYWIPKFSWNNYDKFILGMKFTNSSLLPPRLIYQVSPSISTGTGTATGSAGLSYRWQPADAFFSNWTFGTSGSYYHYDYNLPYKTFNLYTNLNFAKKYRSQINRSISFSYSYFQKELTPELIAEKAYGKYNLWNLGYSYSNNRAIHEDTFRASLQWMEDFQKASVEYFYRWEYAENKRMMFRFFGAYFLTNNTRNDLFNFGISRVSNYAFNYGLLGQSAVKGFLSQQYILAEGGFKSNFNTSVNQWLLAGNFDTHLWKWFNLYADVGVYKNTYHSPEFIWDSGLKLKIIPDFIEVYFPLQSSLGFEPGKKGYGAKIRYTLNLNLGFIINHLRRGIF